MIDIPILWQFMIILATHYVADFLLQTHWQASNKSKNNMALLEHVAVYMIALGIVTGFLFGFGALWFAYVWINGILHFGTDYFTSRWSSRLFALATKESSRALGFQRTYQKAPTPNDLLMLNIDPARRRHNFFVVIGLDQLIHQTTLAMTLWLIVA